MSEGDLLMMALLWVYLVPAGTALGLGLWLLDRWVQRKAREGKAVMPEEYRPFKAFER